MGLDGFGFSPSFSNGNNSPMMLCFGGENQKFKVFVGVVESSSTSSSNNSCSSNSLSKSKKNPL
ncbi:hypothetical protein GIB67_026971 [Kingdonia uniflora]|uniref:Uncharacterized protein n=1 Tax=Kingdonia uniflora TaxID=39325 RepID=A0A7J7P1F3_9MAGN|nr:hypothetical protein GIB67_026971 [Kingdonia uniflora]